MAAPGSYADRVKQRADMLAVTSRYTRLRRAGHQFVGLCPLHFEKQPSFHVHAERKIFYCFGCGAGGDLFDLVMRLEGLSFSAALEWIRETSGGRRTRAAVFAGRVSQGAKPPGLRSRPPQIARKAEPARFYNALCGAEPELPGGCEAERAALASGIYTPSNNFPEGHRGRR